MRTRPTTLLLATAVAASVGMASPASAAGGEILDAAGDQDLVDILRLTYDNASTAVTMTMTYAALSEAQNQSFYMRWTEGGVAQSYQVFTSTNGQTVLRHNNPDNVVDCPALSVTPSGSTNSTTVVVPRSCIPAAPDTLQFQGIATAGLFLADETAVSGLVARTGAPVPPALPRTDTPAKAAAAAKAVQRGVRPAKTSAGVVRAPAVTLPPRPTARVVRVVRVPR